MRSHSAASPQPNENKPHAESRRRTKDSTRRREVMSYGNAVISYPIAKGWPLAAYPANVIRIINLNEVAEGAGVGSQGKHVGADIEVSTGCNSVGVGMFKSPSRVCRRRPAKLPSTKNIMEQMLPPLP